MRKIDEFLDGSNRIARGLAGTELLGSNVDGIRSAQNCGPADRGVLRRRQQLNSRGVRVSQMRLRLCVAGFDECLGHRLPRGGAMLLEILE
jgi:hypothetical protein